MRYLKDLILLVVALLPLITNAQPSEGPEISSMSKHPIFNMQVNGLNYYYVEAGQGDETIFFLHGFPDIASTWDETIDSLSGSYRCIAPFLRGYYPTDTAPDGNYHSTMIAKDIHAIAQKKGIDRFYLVGQDWGAFVVYNIASMFPESVTKAVTIGIPHSSSIKLTPRTIYKARHFAKFRNEEKSVRDIREGNFEYLDVLFKRWSPDWSDYTTTCELVKKTFVLEGRLEAALGYYWSLNAGTGDPKLDSLSEKIPEVPLLAIAGKKDGASTLKPFYRMQKIMDENFKLLINEEAGHFLHREKPAYFIGHLRTFLKE